MSILKTVPNTGEYTPPVRLRLALSAQELADRAQASARAAPGSRIRRDPPATPPPLDPSPELLKRRVAEEIDYAKRLLKATGENLAADSICLQRHVQLMQSFDIIEQMLGHLANVAGAADPCEAISRIGMQDLRNRLNRGAVDGEAPCTAV